MSAVQEEQRPPDFDQKRPYQQPVVPRKIQQLRFGVLSASEIVNTSEISVHSATLYERPERRPQANGVLDSRLGISRKTDKCATCGQVQVDCTGHYGYIQLQLPVFHSGYLKATQQMLSCICKTCGKVLLSEDERRVKMRQCSRVHDRMGRQAVFKQVLDKCKTTKRCHSCGAGNGIVKKAAGMLKLVHERYRDPTERQNYLTEFKEALINNEQLKPLLAKVADELNPLRVLELFRKVSDEDCALLGLSGRPEHLLMTHVPVPPVCIRPSVEMDGGTNEDDLTVKLTEIVTTNSVLRENMELGQPPYKVVEAWDQVQLQTATLVNADQPGLASGSHAPGKPLRGLAQRLKGKQGRFRGNLSGKRVDFTGRTVISPDPNLSMDEVAVPLQVARTLTFPERVGPHNIDSLRRAVLNGVHRWPGANFVIDAKENKTWLKYGDRAKFARELRVGDIVERHLKEGDVVLFNRQPSLHRISIMAHRVRVLPWRTFRFNECVCAPYNADFDGDEMNLHVPQTEEARAEAALLMGVTHNLCTPKNGDILVAATQDFLMASFLITGRDTFYTRSEMGRLACYMGDALGHIHLPLPTIVKPVELWTGKQLFSLLIRPHADVRIQVNLETKEKAHKPGTAPMCPNDAWVCFSNSELVAGRLGKATLGGGNKAGLFQVLSNDYSPQTAAIVMHRLAKLSARFTGNRGFSIGIDDVTPAPLLQAKKQATVSAGYAECEDLIAQYNAGKLELQAGCNMEESLESLVTGKLNAIRETASQVCMKTLQSHNSPLIMSQAGSKGSPINIAQMVACVGQQSVGGKRAPNGFRDRALPHFARGDKAPAGKGFVANSFYSGLTPTEFFFHTMAGREGLVDTAVKTAETGYMSRRLMKALEDLFVHYDSTVRNTANGIVQFEYGDDGRDPVAMEGSSGQALDLERMLSHTRATTCPRDPTDPFDDAIRLSEAVLPSEVKALLPGMLQELAAGDEHEQGLREVLCTFLEKELGKWEQSRRSLGLPEVLAGNPALEAQAAACAPSAQQVQHFFQACAQRYRRKVIDPGATVGAFGAQSIGEPGTQMTLKTFHFAGVASMNITLGVPRIKEIINAAKTIATPIMDVALSVDTSERSARIVKARLEKTTLGQVARWLKAALLPGQLPGIMVKLNLDTIAALQLDLTPFKVMLAISNAPKVPLKMEHLRQTSEDTIWVDPFKNHEKAKTTKKSAPWLFALQQLQRQLPDVVVAGVPSVQRAVISQDGVRDGKARYKLVVEGSNLAAVLGMEGVEGARSWSNHILEVRAVLGIEAARAKVMEQINYTMGQHGMAIDPRHIMLLADTMTYRGEVLGMTRFGIGKMKDSVLMLASFEKTTDILFEAALRGTVDDVTAGQPFPPCRKTPAAMSNFCGLPQQLSNFQGNFACNQSVTVGRPANVVELLGMVTAFSKVKAVGVGHSWWQEQFCSGKTNDSINIVMTEMANTLPVINDPVFSRNTSADFPIQVDEGQRLVLVVALQFALANGTLTTFTAQDTPYYLWHSLTKAVGRLGIITKVTLQIVPNIQVRRTLDQMSTQAFINQIKITQAAYNQALAEGSPEAIADALSQVDETQAFWYVQNDQIWRVDYTNLQSEGAIPGPNTYSNLTDIQPDNTPGYGASLLNLDPYDQYEVSVDLGIAGDCMQTVHDAIQEQDLGIGFRIPGLIRFVGQEEAWLSNANGAPRMFFNLEDHLSHQTGRENVPFQASLHTVIDIFRTQCGARLHWGKAGWPQHAPCFDGAVEYNTSWCQFGCAVQELDPFSKFSSTSNIWSWNAQSDGQQVSFGSCCTSKGFSANCTCAPRTDCASPS
ncbi:hypothetical protein WJX73_006743 [Symbiochloris irregularis]|uniref:DNA-directed RNA polymerase subunit n=1 Tax=Symbiochloris irregularis TaxID=706552 RepID=A0AAW1NWQ0_9CHLO